MQKISRILPLPSLRGTIEPFGMVHMCLLALNNMGKKGPEKMAKRSDYRHASSWFNGHSNQVKRSRQCSIKASESNNRGANLSRWDR
jgi:hypothetical protein